MSEGESDEEYEDEFFDPDCIDCHVGLQLVDGGEWPSVGPLCYGCLMNRFEAANAENEQLKAVAQSYKSDDSCPCPTCWAARAVKAIASSDDY